MVKMNCLIRTLLWSVLLVILLFKSARGLNSAYGYTCNDGYCDKTLILNESDILSLDECHLLCNEYASLWPKPTGKFVKKDKIKAINSKKIFVQYETGTEVETLMRSAEEIFLSDVQEIIGDNPWYNHGAIFVVDIKIHNSTITQIDLDTNESYSLHINSSSAGVVQAFIESHTFFGARHALQTITQLIIFDDLRDQLKILGDVQISDGPAYPYRGLMLDTSRNYFTIQSIKKTLRGMALSKLNRFHWHITDTQSFPYYSKSHPELSRLGAYNAHKVYNTSVIQDIIEYARVRGIRVVPEVDTPSHVGAGWETTGFTTCYNWLPWDVYCVEPPCGQLDPTVDGLYDYIEELFGDIIEDFQPDIFHMGGDEVSFACWNATERIVEWMGNQSMGRTEDDFIKVVQYYHTKALERLHKRAGTKIPVIVWQSQLTRPQYITSSFDVDNVIVQIWANANYSQNQDILDRDFKVLLSNYDALYLDCGQGAWNTDGTVNWCSPYKTWQMIYNNTPESIAGARKEQVIGQEAPMWTEQVDPATLDTLLWPRLASMAEVVWSEPATGSWRDAEVRMIIHRQRLLRAGIDAEAMIPEWCLHRQEVCRIDSYFNELGRYALNNRISQQ